MTRPFRRKAEAIGVVLGVLLLALGLGWYFFPRERPLDEGSPQYAELVVAFYRGLASLEAGLIDNARSDFTRATAIAPGEPAAWTNLGVTHVRVGEFDQAEASLAQAETLAPGSADVAFARALADAARGTLDAATARFRRVLEIDPAHVRARFALAAAVERAAGPGADEEAQRLIDELLQARPDNLAVLLERTRLAARRGDAERMRDSLARLQARAAAWPPSAVEQVGALATAVMAGDMAAAARATAFLRNVLTQQAAFREDLVEVSVPAELIAEPLARFVVLPAPAAMPAPPDETISYVPDPMPPAGPFSSPGALALDWNGDFLLDVLRTGADGVRLALRNEAGAFEELTGSAGDQDGQSVSAAWAADVEMDGDLDAVLGMVDGPPVVMRNSGASGWTLLRPWTGVSRVRGFVWGDLDRDGDPDPAMLDADGELHVFTNQQAGAFDRAAAPPVSGVVALAMADADADGVLELIVLSRDGRLTAAALGRDGWTSGARGAWTDMPAGGAAGDYRVLAGDLDNNGAIDLVGAGRGATRVWLGGAAGELRPLARAIDGEVFAVRDDNADGRLDLLALSGGRPVRLLGRGERSYSWQTIRPRALQRAGDQRINSFGVGGEIEIRSGLLTQKQLITSDPAHFGLGERTGVDVARILWPNGVAQAEFDLQAGRDVVAEQRLKGSCPWLFTWNGEAMTFVTDVLWRSPLGLRINAQDTASIGESEDWVLVRGDQLAPRDGHYDVRITAELWETHYFDHVALMAVDHPADVEVYVDERFARAPQARVVRAFAPSRPVSAAWDDRGHDVTALVRDVDGRHLGGFEKGRYQGIARDHAVELEVGAGLPAATPFSLILQGWVYPTDSSINVAIAQARHEPPRGLSLEAQAPDGRWTVVYPDLGFPAGKNKTMIVDVPASARPRTSTRLRLRTNLEVYWDRLAYATERKDAPLAMTKMTPTDVELRYRGYSQTVEDRDAHAPETPHYERLANTAPRWRDLVGYHTRFGDVLELLAGVDNRYAILNAGDELRFRFAALPPASAGTRRDFVLISDGWEKDGDYNTAYSKTVQPLPRHGVPEYAAPNGSTALEDDPIYQRHRDDWLRFHTRFVAPDRFLRGLRLP